MTEGSVKRVAINGLGRIGRMVLRRYFENTAEYGDIEIVAANDLVSSDIIEYLIKYDSVHGRFNGTIEQKGKSLIINGNEVMLSSEPDPRNLPWRKLDIDIAVECTGFFKTHEQLSRHLEAGAKKVIFSAPSPDPDLTVVMGVNDHKYDNENHHILSNASCTTNSLAPLAKVLLDRFGIDYLFATTVHAYTSSQALVDKPADKMSRGRSGAVSIIPSSTGAAKATALVIPELEGKMEAIALRVPIPDGAITEICSNLQKYVTVEELNDALREASQSERLKSVIGYTDDDIVSIDIIGDTHSTIVHSRSTKVLGRKMIYMQAWYDNEWGYSCRLLDLASLVARKLESRIAVAVAAY